MEPCYLLRNPAQSIAHALSSFKPPPNPHIALFHQPLDRLRFLILRNIPLSYISSSSYSSILLFPSTAKYLELSSIHCLPFFMSRLLPMTLYSGLCLHHYSNAALLEVLPDTHFTNPMGIFRAFFFLLLYPSSAS